MIVIVEDEVFSSPRTDSLALLSLFQLGYEGQHRVQTEPLYHPAADQGLNRWLATLAPTLHDAVILALEAGLEGDVSGIPSDLTIQIGTDSQSDWESVPPRLPLPAALSFLRRPLRILVENRHNDGAFLRVVAPPPWRGEYLKLQKKGWIELDHGGGLGDMQTRAETVRHEEALRLWALFDSDAREPGVPSQRSEALRSTCLEARIAHHQLRRRFIESYLPVSALLAWAHKSSGAVRRARREAAEAFASMEPRQRHHYNLKGGFNKDRQTGIPSSTAPMPKIGTFRLALERASEPFSTRRISRFRRSGWSATGSAKRRPRCSSPSSDGCKEHRT